MCGPPQRGFAVPPFVPLSPVQIYRQLLETKRVKCAVCDVFLLNFIYDVNFIYFMMQFMMFTGSWASSVSADETRDAFSSRSFYKVTENRQTLIFFLAMGIFYIFSVTRTTVSSFLSSNKCYNGAGLTTSSDACTVIFGHYLKHWCLLFS